jgi:hypothetical protein
MTARAAWSGGRIDFLIDDERTDFMGLNRDSPVSDEWESKLPAACPIFPAKQELRTCVLRQFTGWKTILRSIYPIYCVEIRNHEDAIK